LYEALFTSRMQRPPSATHCNTLNHMLEKGLVLWGMFCYSAERGCFLSAAFCTHIHTYTHRYTHTLGVLCCRAFLQRRKKAPPQQQRGDLLQRRKCCLLQHRKDALSRQQIISKMRVYVCVYFCIYVYLCACVAVCDGELHLVLDKESEKATHTRNIIHHNAVTHNVEQHPHLPAIHTRQLLHRSIHTLEQTVVLQCVAVCCRVLQYVTVRPRYNTHTHTHTHTQTHTHTHTVSHAPASPQSDLHS